MQPFELIKLITGILIVIIPGYLWSFLFFKHLTRLERFVFGFVFGLGVLTCAAFMGNVVFNIKITQTFIVLLFSLYALPVFILYGLSIYRFGLPKIDLTPIKDKKFLLLMGILVFTFFMMFLPHLSNNYFLPFHVDEWIHWSYSRAVMESGSTIFLNPYTGVGTIANPEIGFHTITASIVWLSGTNLLTVFVFMPSIIAAFICLTAFNIGERSQRKFGLESAFLIAFIPTTIRFLGPSFYVAVTLGLLLLIFIIWLGQLKKPQGIMLITVFIWCMFLIHPPTVLAGTIVMIMFSLSLVLEKEYKIALLTSVSSALATLLVIIAYYFTTIWDYYIELFLQGISGKVYLLGLPEIWVDFEHLGLVTWVLFVIGIYYSFLSGKFLKRSLSFSAIVFIIIIGLYIKLEYGVPILYERTFLYLFLMVALIAGVGLSELRKSIEGIVEKKPFKKYKRLPKNLKFIPPVAVCILLLTSAVPSHLGISYYQMIDEKDYEAFNWIRDNIKNYRDGNHSYDKAAVHPFKASPFSAVTGLYIVSSSMHPIYGISLWAQMEKFLDEKCVNISFLEQHRLSVVYGPCDNEYLTEVYENIFLYYGFPPEFNFTYHPDKPRSNDTIVFTSNFTSPFSRIVGWEWDFGDGISGYGKTTGLEFDGIDDYVMIPDDEKLDITNAITIEAWIKLTADLNCDEHNNWREVFSKSGSWNIILEQNQKPTWSVKVREKSYRWFGSTPAWPLEEWFHVAWTYESATGEMTAFFNGNKSTYNIETTGSLDTTDNVLRINRPSGETCPKGGGNFPGAIHDVRVYNRVLTDDEISQNYNAMSDDDIDTNGLVSWWKMDEMGKTVQDSISNNDGIIYGAKWLNHVEHTYNNPGTYQVNLTVWSDEGLQNSVSKYIIIS